MKDGKLKVENWKMKDKLKKLKIENWKKEYLLDSCNARQDCDDPLSVDGPVGDPSHLSHVGQLVDQATVVI